MAEALLLERSAPLEVRVSGRTLRTEVPYGVRATDRAEMFAPGALEPASTVTLNVQHDRGLEIATTVDGSLRLRNTPQSMVVEAELRGTAKDGPLGLVTRGALRGISPEFRCYAESSQGGLRVVERAGLEAFGLVDVASYDTPLEVRQMEGTWLRATIPYSRRMQCECAGPSCSEVVFEEGSLDVGSEGDVLAVGGNYLNVLGSRKRGTLVTEDTGAGLRVGLTNNETDTARRIIEAAAVTDIFVRPLLDLDASEYTESEGVRLFTLAAVRALLVKPTTARQGHIPAEIDGIPEQRTRRLVL